MFGSPCGLENTFPRLLWGYSRLTFLMLIELPTTFFPGRRVDDFYSCGSSSSRRGPKYWCLWFIYDEPVSLMRRRWMDVSVWRGWSRRLWRWRLLHDTRQEHWFRSHIIVVQSYLHTQSQFCVPKRVLWPGLGKGGGTSSRERAGQYSKSSSRSNDLAAS